MFENYKLTIIATSPRGQSVTWYVHLRKAIIPICQSARVSNATYLTVSYDAAGGWTPTGYCWGESHLDMIYKSNIDGLMQDWMHWRYCSLVLSHQYNDRCQPNWDPYTRKPFYKVFMSFIQILWKFVLLLLDYLNNNDEIMLRFWPCHDSWAVVTWAKL